MKVLAKGSSSCASRASRHSRLKLADAWARMWLCLMCTDGQDLVEYCLVTGLVSTAALAVFQGLAAPLVGLLGKVATTVSAA